MKRAPRIEGMPHRLANAILDRMLDIVADTLLLNDKNLIDGVFNLQRSALSRCSRSKFVVNRLLAYSFRK